MNKILKKAKKTCIRFFLVGKRDYRKNLPLLDTGIVFSLILHLLSVSLYVMKIDLLESDIQRGWEVAYKTTNVSLARESIVEVISALEKTESGLFNLLTSIPKDNQEVSDWKSAIKEYKGYIFSISETTKSVDYPPPNMPSLWNLKGRITLFLFLQLSSFVTVVIAYFVYLFLHVNYILFLKKN